MAITVPPQLKVQDDRSGILAGFLDLEADVWSLGVVAVGPTQLTPQPPSISEATLSEWLLKLVSTRRPETFTRSSVPLPVGAAVEVRFTFDGGTRDEVAVVAYAIPTSAGVAYLMANCQAKPMSRCDEFLRLVPQLFELNLPGAAG